MKHPSRFKQPRLRRRDWIGDAILTLLAGGILLTAVFLPWVNNDAEGQVNYSVIQHGELNGVLETRWGIPATVLAAVVLLAGAAMLLSRPRRASILLGLLVAALGLGVFTVAQDAAAHIGFLHPGLGMYLTTLTGILLVPIGLAAALVAWVLSRASVPTTAPPAPGNDPPI